MSDPEASPIPEPDTPAPGLPEAAPAPEVSSEPESPSASELHPAEDEPAAEEEPAPDNAENLRGLFSERLQEILTGILDRLDKAGL